MVGKNAEKGNTFIFLMQEYMNSAMKCGGHSVQCAKEIKPLIKDFFNKAMSVAKVREDGTDVCSYIESIAEAVKYLARNTRNYARIKDQEVEVLNKIFQEFDALLEETMNLKAQYRYASNLACKISYITEILYRNQVGMHDSKEDHKHWRDGMIFQSYESLWKVIHRVNTEWEELRKRRFSIELFYDFCTVCQYDRSRGKEMDEEEKINNFMSVLDGKMKFILVYLRGYRQIGLRVVNNDFGNKIVCARAMKRNKRIGMRQV